MTETPKINGRIQIDEPRWQQDTFVGRLKHFAWMTDCRTVLTSTSGLLQAKELIEKYREGQEPAGTSDEALWYAKKLTTSAFHPDSGELQNFIGRMSFQVPGGMFITAGMLQFYRTTGAVIFWQWLNQSFNALVNYTNRNAASSLTTKQITTAYLTATSGALVTALGFKALFSQRAPPLVQRFVPFMAVAAANAVNIPMTRQSELIEGVSLFDENNNKVAQSKTAAAKGISLVVLSRIIMAAPGMLTLPFIMEYLEKKPWFMRYTFMHLPFQTLGVGFFLTGMVPLACALFPQRSEIRVETLKKKEAESYNAIVKFYGDNLPDVLYFNKGL
ncbi:hypothetical protein CAPTEDRAFT_179902 [Capitella teleta]|uniref:Sidoreflexin n=1 Tax=Capitella teleta TaxID=283909 RepID=R7T9I2_CAPTE|nr:hypothetical protein CAPTEDRAFT_179902 [Capitella teleta]|eukprot:ELT87634.1 hypothetical protein CAPTEDRAFT_179902 [Capitella teleta]